MTDKTDSGAPRLADLYRRMRNQFRQADLDTADLDARLLVCHALALDPVTLVSQPDRPVSADEQKRMNNLVERRLAREPVARILGEREFWGLRFAVSPHTLDPRADTETLVGAVADHLRRRAIAAPFILDVGTGTGAILLALLSECAGARGVGTDIDPRALRIARENAVRQGVAGRARFVCANYLETIRGAFDAIVSNPPYIRSEDIAGLAPEVACFDPIRALDGGADGLDAYRALFESAASNLRSGGVFAVEFGAGQFDSVARIARKAGFSTVEAADDLGGHARVALTFLP